MRAKARYYVQRVRREVRDAVLRMGRDQKTVREDVAARYLVGDGIEIGALNFPLRLPSGARVRYVDREPHERLLAEYGALYPGTRIVAPDVIDDGEVLSSFADSSVDFIVANHMLEHTEDPIGTLRSHLRVVRPGGILFYALPDARATAVDRERQRTSTTHLLRDHIDGPEVSRRQHYEEWVRFGERFAEDDIARRAAELESRRTNIHFHVWEPRTFAAFIADLELRFDLELLQMNAAEFIVVLRRSSEP
jgi:SAM-dependent methyltransferase